MQPKLLLSFALLCACRDIVLTYPTSTGPYQPPEPPKPPFLTFTDAETPAYIGFSSQAILTATDAGLVVVDRQTKDSARLDERSGLVGHTLTAVLRWDGYTFVAGPGFVARYQGKWESMPGAITPFVLAPDPSKEGVLVGAKEGLFRVQPQKATPITEKPIYDALSSSDSVLVASEDGLYRFDGKALTSQEGWKGIPLLWLAQEGSLLLSIARDDKGRPRRLYFGTPEKPLGHTDLWDDARVAGNGTCALSVGRRIYRLFGVEERTVNFSLGDTKRGFFQVGITDRTPTALATEGERVYVGLPSHGVISFGGPIEQYTMGDLLPTSERAFLGSDTKGVVFVPTTTGPFLARFNGERFERYLVDTSWDASIIAISSRGDQVFAVVQRSPGGPLLFKKIEGDEATDAGQVSVPSLPRQLRATFLEISPQGDFWMGLEDENGYAKGLLWVSADFKQHQHLRQGIPGTIGELEGVKLPSDAVAQVRFVRGATWIATNGGVIWRRGEKMRIFGENEGLDSELVRDVAVDRLELVWLATASGVGVLQKGNYWNFDRYRNVLGDLRVRALLTDTEGTMWVGTDGGTYFWKESKQNAEGEWGNITKRQGLCGDLVADLAQDALGRVWYLTEGGFCVAPK